MAAPKHLRLFTLFVDGENEVGKVTSVTPPKLTRKTDSYRGGWYDGGGGVLILPVWTTPRLMRVLYVGAVRALFLKHGGSIDGTLLRFAGEYYTDAKAICMKSRCAGV